VLAEVVGRFNWLCHAYCLMTDHYHLVVETPDGNLSKGVRQLNGVYTQASNRRHQRTEPIGVSSRIVVSQQTAYGWRHGQTLANRIPISALSRDLTWRSS
jgi:REP element-mobilizing transposase RayT